ncbi:MAG: transposase, partial [Anaerolineae bacterium]|nr:transposase [Anaerolineae bacterium]
MITAACYEHKPIFDSPDLLSFLRDEMLTRLSRILQCEAWVFLPNHYHIVLNAPELAVVSEILRIGHSKISTTVNGLQNRKGRKVWYRFADRMIRNEQHYWATINYIHYNPIKHGYVDKMTDWSWSSVHDFFDTFGEDKLKGFGKIP